MIVQSRVGRRATQASARGGHGRSRDRPRPPIQAGGSDQGRPLRVWMKLPDVLLPDGKVPLKVPSRRLPATSRSRSASARSSKLFLRLNRPRLNRTVTVCAAFAAPGGETDTLVIV